MITWRRGLLCVRLTSCSNSEISENFSKEIACCFDSLPQSCNVREVIVEMPYSSLKQFTARKYVLLIPFVLVEDIPLCYIIKYAMYVFTVKHNYLLCLIKSAHLATGFVQTWLSSGHIYIYTKIKAVHGLRCKCRS